jgi:shikimate kinase
MIIFLTGFMGVGKTTIGEQLADLLEIPFVDLDRAIEIRNGKSISAIFREEGEDAFRNYEELELHIQIKQNRSLTVIALGGGTVAHHLNHIPILKNGILVYLKKEWDDLLIGLEKLENRPVLKDKSPEQLYSLFKKRRPFYELSQLQTLVGTHFDVKNLAFSLKLLTNR